MYLDVSLGAASKISLVTHVTLTMEDEREDELQLHADGQVEGRAIRGEPCRPLQSNDRTALPFQAVC